MLAWIEEARAGGAAILTGGELDGELLRPTVVERPPADVEARLRGGVRARLHARSRTTRSRRRSRSRTARATASRPGSSRSALASALCAAGELEFGGVTINEAPTFRADQMPYGGVKDSGNTREGPAWAVRELTEERLVVVQL